MNPYSSYLGGADPLTVISGTSKKLDKLIEALGAKGVERSFATGKWTARQMFCHLADTELVFAFRLRQALAESHHVIQPFDQDKWAASYDSVGAQAAVDLFTAVRNWNIAFIQAVPAEAFSKILTHPERGEMTIQVLVETMAGHDLNHLRQLEAIAWTAPL